MVLDVAAAAVGSVAAADALYLAALSVAALWSTEMPPTGNHSARLTVLVPAYNEADYIKRCVDSLLDQHYPRDRYAIVVIADNCTDATAGIAAAAGAEVLVRDQPDARGKGQALRWAMDQVLVRSPAPDAIVVVDADSIAEPELLAGLAARLEAGAQAVQGDYQVLAEDESARSDLRRAALILFHRVRFGGRAVLGLPCNLVGNGMLFSRDLLERHPWDAFTGAEDLEFSIGLRLAGVGPVFAPEARLAGPVPTGGKALRVQQRRWTGGRFYIVRSQLPKLVSTMVRRRDWSLLDAVVDLATPPLGLLAAGITGGTIVVAALSVAGVTAPWTIVPWAVALVALPSFVLVGLRAADSPASMYRSLAQAPGIVAAQMLGYLPLLKGLHQTSWERTERPSEAS